jgi:hypothetical protein
LKVTEDELRWRAGRVGAVENGTTTDATAALLDLTYNEVDRAWLQRFLLECTAVGRDPQVRRLAVTCLGHVARLDGRIDDAVRERLQQLMSDPDLGGTAEDALGDILDYVDRQRS